MAQKFNIPYEQLVKVIDDLPMTWIPALLKQVVKVGYKMKVFKPGGASTMVRRIEIDLGHEWTPEAEA